MSGRTSTIKAAAAVALIAATCGAITTAQMPRRPERSSMDSIAQQYVRIVLALGQHDPDYVDAYYGPPEWKNEAQAAKLDLSTIGDRAARLRRDLKAEGAGTPAAHGAGSEELRQLRREYLEHQLVALETRVRMLKGERLSFDEESRALYDAVAPTYPESHFKDDPRSARSSISRRWTAGRTVRRVAPRVRHSARAARHGLQGGDRRLSRPHAGARATARPTSTSPSNTSPTSRGAATTGIRATSAA